MKVVFVSTLEAGGPVSHLLDLAPAIAAFGVEVRVLCQTPEVAARFEACGVGADVTTVRSKWDVRSSGRLRGVLRGADVVHSQDRRAGLFARVLGRTNGSAIVHTYHGLPEDLAVRVGRSEHEARHMPLTPRRRLWLFGIYLPLESLLARCGAVVVPSQAMADFLVSVHLPAARIHVIRSGIDVRRRVAPAAHRPLRIATAANLEPWKGIDVLLEAAAIVDRPCQLDIYGDGSERPRLEAQAARLGVEVTFHGRVDDVRERLLGADVVALPSRAENLPIAVLEAMAASVPVVATAVGGVPELIRDGDTGIVVPPEDPPALASAFRVLFDDEARRVRLGEAGAARANAAFRPDEAALRTVHLYEDLCASSR